MITDLQKQEIVEIIHSEARTLGSYNKLANKLGISSATLSANLRKPENWHQVKDDLWRRIGKLLGYKFQSSVWQTVETENFKIMQAALQVAQEECLFLGVSFEAGSGKSETIKYYKRNDTTESVFVLECKKWGRQRFLTHLAMCLGVKVENDRVNSERLSEQIIGALRQKSSQNLPLLVLDQANSLRSSALTWLIDLYNELKGDIGVVVCGTEHLRDNIKKGVAKHIEGYDEIDSRFGRTYIKLLGYTREDVGKMANANGLHNDGQIERIWLRCEPKEVVINGKYVMVVQDGRVLERKIIAATKLAGN